MSIRLADIRVGDTVFYDNNKEQHRTVVHISYESGMLVLEGRNQRLHYSKVKALIEKKDYE